MKLSFLFVFLLQSVLTLYPNVVWAGTYPKCDENTEVANDANRTCDLTAEAQAARAAVDKCKDLTGDARSQCLLQNGTTSTAGVENTTLSSWTQGMTITTQVAQTAASIMNLAFYDKGSCQMWSWTLMNLGAMAASLGELSSYFFVYYPKTKDMHAKFKEEIKNTDTSAAQGSAFKYLKEEQDIKATTETIRAVSHGVAGALYASAMIMAIVEIGMKYNPYTAGNTNAMESACQTAGVNQSFINGGLFKILSVASGVLPVAKYIFPVNDIKKENNVYYDLKKDVEYLRYVLSSPMESTITIKDQEESWFGNKVSSTKVSDYEKWKIHELYSPKSLSKLVNAFLDNLFIPSAQAQYSGLMSMVAKMLTNPEMVAKMTQIKANIKSQEQFKRNAEVRAWTAGVMFGLETTVTTMSALQAKEHQKRSEAYGKMAKPFESLSDDNLHLCVTNDEGRDDRNDSSKPNCYCYKEENGTSKPNESRLKDPNCAQYFGLSNPTVGDYNGGTGGGGKVCFKKDGTMDMECKCKQQKDAKGNNACMKAAGNFGIGGNIGFTGLGNQALSAFNALASGDTTGASGIQGSSGNYAAFANKLKRKMNDELKKNGKPTIDFAGGEKKVLGELVRSANQLIKANGLDSGSNAASPLIASVDPKLAEKLEKTAKENGTTTSDLKFNNTVPLVAKKEGGFDLGDLSGGAGSGEIVDMGSSDTMAKNFNYGSNDINSGENLFKVISNRYLMSGLKRLFEEDKPAEPTPLKK